MHFLLKVLKLNKIIKKSFLWNGIRIKIVDVNFQSSSTAIFLAVESPNVVESVLSVFTDDFNVLFNVFTELWFLYDFCLR